MTQIEQQLIDKLLHDFHKECEKLPPPPPGMMYVSEMTGVMPPDDKGNVVVDMTMKLQPIIKTED